MRVFGSTVYAHIHKDLRKKFEPKSSPCIFIGFTEGVKGYKILNKRTRQVTHTRDAVFVEGIEAHQPVGEVISASSSSDGESEEVEEIMVGQMAVPLPVPQAAGAPIHVPQAAGAPAHLPRVVPLVPQRTSRPYTPVRTGN